MSKESISEQTLISNLSLRNRKSHTDRATTATNAEDILAKLRQRWSFLHVRSHFDEFLKSYKLKSLAASEILESRGSWPRSSRTNRSTLEPDEKCQILAVSVQTPEGKLDGQFTIELSEEKAPKPAFLPFLVCRWVIRAGLGIRAGRDSQRAGGAHRPELGSAGVLADQRRA